VAKTNIKTATKKVQPGKTAKAPAKAAAKTRKAPVVKPTKLKKAAAPIRQKAGVASSTRKQKMLKPLLPPVPLPPVKAEPLKKPPLPAALRAFEHAVRVFNRRRFEEAKALFENIQQRYGHEAEIVGRAQMYIQVCNQKLAQRASLPRNVSADELYDRGVYALNIGDFTQARQFFEKALRLKPNEAHLLYSLAVTHAQTGAHEQALDYLRRSIQIQPRFRKQAYNDSDLSGLRENKQFQELLGLTSPFERLEPRN
jgi:tetratricopeptide (TPR) repeat protein